MAQPGRGGAQSRGTEARRPDAQVAQPGRGGANAGRGPTFAERNFGSRPTAGNRGGPNDRPGQDGLANRPGSRPTTVDAARNFGQRGVDRDGRGNIGIGRDNGRPNDIARGNTGRGPGGRGDNAGRGNTGRGGPGAARDNDFRRPLASDIARGPEGGRGGARDGDRNGRGSRGGTLNEQWFGGTRNANFRGGRNDFVRNADWRGNNWRDNNWRGGWGGNDFRYRGGQRGDWNRWGGDWNRYADKHFNNQWSGGWNKWHDRSYFFGASTPFGGYYRGYYPWYGTNFWPAFAFNFFPSYGYGWNFGGAWWGGYCGVPIFNYATYLDCWPYYYDYGYANYAYSYPYVGYGVNYSYPAYANTYSYSYPVYETTYSYPTYSVGYPTTLASYGSYVARSPLTVVDPVPEPVVVMDDAMLAPAPAPQQTVTAAQPPVAQPPAAPPTSVNDLTAADFAGQAEIDFRAGNYEAAVRNFRHALVDDPTNAGVVMMLGQALFALANFDEAAGATAMAMQALPPDKWGAVLENYQQLYGNPADYQTQLRALEQARDREPNSPALHFLTGFHYAYRGDAAKAVAELNKTLELEPRDAMARALKDRMQAKIEGRPLPSQ